ncbi:MAG: molybdopterin-binding protein [Desulfobacterales bacterium]|nr:molybdopterin-binding protein [Desulfobacterales bacterium]
MEVARLHGVGDDLHRLRDLLKEVGGRADVCVATGGLGPTVDDLSAEAAAEAAGVGLRLDPTATGLHRGVFPNAQPADEPLHPQAGHAAGRGRRPLQPGRHRARLQPDGRALPVFSCRASRSK